MITAGLKVTREGQEIDFEDLKKGDIFDLYEPDGQLIGRKYRALSDAYPVEPPGNWGVNCDHSPLERKPNEYGN